MPEKFGYSYLYENQAPYPAERDDCGSPLKHDKFRQIFPNFHHRDHGTLSVQPPLPFSNDGTSYRNRHRPMFHPQGWKEDSGR